jgi:hypothetical protein
MKAHHYKNLCFTSVLSPLAPIPVFLYLSRRLSTLPSQSIFSYNQGTSLFYQYLNLYQNKSRIFTIGVYTTYLSPLVLNTITQLVCVAGVHRLTTRVSALAVTLVLDYQLSRYYPCGTYDPWFRFYF